MTRSLDASAPLRRLLADYGLTQEDFARANDMGIATANRWVNGKVLVSEKKLAKAITAVGANPQDYGVDAPRGHAATQPLAADEVPPAWFSNQQLQTDAKLDALYRLQEQISKQNERIIDLLEHRR